MEEYNQYVSAVNKIFDYLDKMKTGWNSLDNRNYLDKYMMPNLVEKKN